MPEGFSAPLPPPHILPRRLLALAVGMIVIVLAARIGWGRWIDRRLESLLADVRRLGQPMTADDLDFSQIPPDQNAWTKQAEAAAYLTEEINSPRSGTLPYPTKPAEWDAWWAADAKAEAAYQPLFAAMREARRRPNGKVNLVPTAPYATPLLPHLNTMRSLANTMADGAEYQHHLGNDAEMLDRCGDILHLADTTFHGPTLVSYLVGAGIDDLAFELIRTTFDDPAWKDRPFPASLRPQIQSLLDGLRDETVVRQYITRNTMEDRVDYEETTAAQTRYSWLIRPLATYDRCRMLTANAGELRAVQAANGTEAAGILSQYPSLRSGRWVGPSSPLPAGVVPRYSRFLETPIGFGMVSTVQFRFLRDRREITIGLAMELFKADHGQYPATMEQLLPTYLKSIPDDPLARAGTPMYRPKWCTSPPTSLSTQPVH